jgi:hypothetical protein
MRGDVWVSVNKNGEKILHIDNGKFVKKRVIKEVKKFTTDKSGIVNNLINN